MTHAGFSIDSLKIDAAREAERIEGAVREFVFVNLRRKGVVIGLSGGVDSSLVAALSARALGQDRVLGLFTPEAESSGESLRLGRRVADFLGIKTELEDIGPVLKAAGCYKRRDEAVRLVIPEYGPGYKCKIVLPALSEGAGYAIFSVVAEAPDGRRIRARLTPEAYSGVVAGASLKQRTRKMMEYYHADRLHYAVAGTPNRLEYDQGFFVKNGDGAADLKPIAHLYKTQVYQLAEYLGIPEEIRRRLPTTDTYSLEQSQEEFYFGLPYDKLDLCLYGKNHEVPKKDVARAAGLTLEQVERAYRDIDSKRRAARFLHLPPLLVEEMKEAPSSSRIVKVGGSGI